MERTRLGRLARARYALPALVALALATLAINEALHAQTLALTRRTGQVVDARIAVMRLYQGIATAGVGAVTFIESGLPVDRAQHDAFAALVAAQSERTLALLVETDPGGAALHAEVGRHVEHRLALLSRWVAMAAEGRSDEARRELGAPESSRTRVALRESLERELVRLEAAHLDSRTGVLRNQSRTVWALRAMIVLAALAAALVMRQLHTLAALREQGERRLRAEVDERTAALRELSGHLTIAQELERSRLARELHDEMGALMTASKLELARLRRLPQLPPPALERLAGLETQINRGISLKRRIIEALRPSALDQLGLAESLAILAEEAARTMDIPVAFEAGEPAELSKDGQLAIYRFVQEALTNVAKYAGATSVAIRLAPAGERVDIDVRDDGRGFDPGAVRSGHHGLRGMQVRFESLGGGVHVDSALDRGTVLHGWLPRSADPPAPPRPPQPKSAASVGTAAGAEPAPAPAPARMPAAAPPPSGGDVQRA